MTDKRNYPKDRKCRTGYARRHPNGELTRVPVGGARNTRPVSIHVRHGGTAKLQHARLDKRTWAGLAYMVTCKDLIAHLGNDPSSPQAMLIDHVARLKILIDVAWGAAIKDGLDQESPAFNNFIKALENQRKTLHLLGLERHSKPLNLADYLEGKAVNEPA